MVSVSSAPQESAEAEGAGLFAPFRFRLLVAGVRGGTSVTCPPRFLFIASAPEISVTQSKVRNRYAFQS